MPMFSRYLAILVEQVGMLTVAYWHSTQSTDDTDGNGKRFAKCLIIKPKY